MVLLIIIININYFLGGGLTLIHCVMINTQMAVVFQAHYVGVEIL